MEKKRYAMFWGCQIPARLPFLEKSYRIALKLLGIEYQDLDFSCCPEKSLIKNKDELAWLVVAARNLALAEREGVNILTACNGCYSVLREALVELNTHTALRERVKGILARVGLEYNGTRNVYHFVELLYDQVGISKIKALVKKPLTGMKIAVHHGCHLIRPSSAIRFDHPLKPTKFDALVEALGAQSLAYETRMLCCGNSLGSAGELEDALAMVRQKVLELQRLGADALVLTCPACFMQYDQRQYMLQRRGEKLTLPVFTYAQLLALAYGISPEELGLESHRIDPAPFIEKMDRAKVSLDRLAQKVSLEDIKRCIKCGACQDDCPVALLKPEFKPGEMMAQALAGNIDQLLAGKEIWYCLECHTCYELCPQKFGWERFLTALKNLALGEGIAPQAIRGAVDSFFKSGRLGEPDQRARKKLGLPEIKGGAKEDLAVIFHALAQERENQG